MARERIELAQPRPAEWSVQLERAAVRAELTPAELDEMAAVLARRAEWTPAEWDELVAVLARRAELAEMTWADGKSWRPCWPAGTSGGRPS